MRLVGYADRLSVEPGHDITFMVSSEPSTYSAELVRLIHGDIDPAGPGFKAERIDSSFAGDYGGVKQRLWPGSYVKIPDRGALTLAKGFTLQLWIFPTTPAKQAQALISRRGPDGTGYALRLDGRRIALHLGDGTISSEPIIQPRTWYFVAAAYVAATGGARVVVKQCSGVVLGRPAAVSGTLEPSAAPAEGDLLIAAEQVGSERPANFYNGKIDAPKVFDRALMDGELEAMWDGWDDDVSGRPIAHWDFSQDISTWTVTDVSGHGHHGTTVNKPMRGATGRNWDGTETAWPHAPEQYGAIHFHDDDLSDAGWDPAFTLSVPPDLRSGVYAVRLSSGEDEDFIPFAVTPRGGRPQSDIALILPMFSYLAYSDEQMANTGGLGLLDGQVEGYPRSPEDAYIVTNGLRSLYDRHTDGSGVCYASWLRPLVNMRPKYRASWLSGLTGPPHYGAPHQLAADLHLVDWLAAMGYEVDVLTDLELHRDGIATLQNYRVVLTGSHCEYWSGEMIDAAHRYLHGGGRLMYLAGNGMYWVTQLDPDTGTSVEVRRRGPAVRTWEPEPGEAHLSSTGELGGLWRYRGRGPHTWLGIGFTSEGGGPGRPYIRQDGSLDPQAGFVFAGIDPTEPIGDVACLVNGYGAAGFELDRADPALGTPEHALVLATADGFTDAFQATTEEILLSDGRQGGSVSPLVRADMVLLQYPKGGAVFSTGSISWCACLSHNGYDNTVSRVTRNVLDGFLQDALPGQDGRLQEALPRRHSED